MSDSARCVWAVVPVKAFAEAKSRLSDVLASRARAQLAERLFDRVRRACADSPGITRTLVATNSAELAGRAQALGLESVLDGARRGLGEVVDQALEHASAHGATAALVVMGDLPLVTPGDLAALLAALEGADVVLGPDREQAGTNAMALRLPAPGPTCFGHADSYGRHRAWCEARGARCVTLRRDGLQLDVDTPRDLRALGPAWATPGEGASEDP